MKAYIGPMTTNEDYSTNKGVVDIEVHDYDVFDVDVTIATIVLPLLQKLKQVRMERIDLFISDEPDEVKAEQQEQWLLDELIWVMHEIVEGCPGSDQFFDESAVDPNTDLMTQVNAMKFDSVGYDAYQERISNALKLFGEHFRSLWS